MVALDVDRCEASARAGADGDERARKELVERLWPFWLNRVRSHAALRRLSPSDDHVYNVVARLVKKLLDQQVLASYVRWREGLPQANFAQWLHSVTDNEVKDYARAVAGRFSAERAEQGPSAKLLLNEFATSPLLDELGIRPPNTELQTAQELLRFARSRLPPEQLQAVTLWLQGATDDEIGGCLNVDESQARALRRAAVARLRREFAPGSDLDQA